MKKSVVTAIAVAGISTLTGAAVLPGTASTDNGGDTKRIHMKRLVLTETASRELRPNAVVGTDLARSAGTHRVVGYDTYSGKFYPKRQKFIVYVALSLDGGIILGRVEFSEDNHFAGPILSGAGKFRGVEGRITGRSLGDDGGRTFVRLRYHF